MLGVGAAIEYYRWGHVNVRAAIVIAVTVLVFAWLGAAVANRVAGPYLRLMFGVFVTGLGLSLAYDAIRQLN